MMVLVMVGEWVGDDVSGLVMDGVGVSEGVFVSGLVRVSHVRW